MPAVAVFAGSKDPTDSEILTAAAALGEKLAAAGYEIVYGGGTQGVMGAVARAALEKGGKVTAVVLDQYSHEPQFAGAAVINVATEQDRFRALSTHGNPVAAFALPGSAGSLREALQGLELAVYENGPPVVLVKVGAYLDGLKDAFDQSVAAGLTRADKKDRLRLWPVTGDLSEVIPPAPPASAKGPDFNKTP